MLPCCDRRIQSVHSIPRNPAMLPMDHRGIRASDNGSTGSVAIHSRRPFTTTETDLGVPSGTMYAAGHKRDIELFFFKGTSATIL